MTTVDDAIEVGAQALAESWTDATEFGSCEDMALTAARAQWPILSAGLRELHSEAWSCGNPRHTNPDVGCPDCGVYCDHCGHDWPCPTEQWRRTIDEELGL